MKTRQEIIDKAKKNLAEVNEIFWDCDHWNDYVRKPHEKPIDPDPDGTLKRIKIYYESLLENEIRISEPKTRG